MSHHNMADNAMLAIIPHTDATHVAVSNGKLSSPFTWASRTVPGAGSVVLIPYGTVVTYDVEVSERLDRLRIDGTLSFALDQSTQLLMETITLTNGSKLIIGNSVTNRLPAQHQCEILIFDP